jgi:ABC-type amino acid transport substrate-binding protein
MLLTLLVVCQSQGKLRWQPLRLGAGAAGSLVLGALLGWGLNRSLAMGLQGQYRNAQVLLNLQPMLAGAAPAVVSTPGPAAPVSLAAIRQRGLLRVGLRGDGLPWAYRNRQGRLVGLDVDLVQALASNLGLRLELVQAKLPTLEKLLDEQRIDLALGGIQASPERAARHQASQGYLKVHLGLVVPDGKLKQLQRLPIQGLAKPLVLAVTDPQLVTTNLRQGISEHLGSAARPLALELVLIDSKELFFAGAASGRYDGWLTPAEGGAAWAVLHPDFSLITPFGKGLSGQLVILAGGNDPNLLDYLNAWLAREQARGLMERLFDHWIRVLPQAQSNRHG